jgi:FkbM family methyltransferase
MSTLSRIFRRALRPFRQQSFALNELDWKLAQHLDFDGGFFIEAGANDGRRYSNTLYFEKYQSWSGLLIEPIPELARQCRLNRPNCIVENAALVPADYEQETIDMRYCDLMSLVKGGMKSREEEDEHIRLGVECQSVETHELTVAARALSDILDQHGIAEIDLLSLDVEGFELAALKGLDLDRHRPRFMLVEARYRQEIDDFLTPGYEALSMLSHHDVLYRRVHE